MSTTDSMNCQDIYKNHVFDTRLRTQALTIDLYKDQVIIIFAYLQLSSNRITFINTQMS